MQLPAIYIEDTISQQARPPTPIIILLLLLWCALSLRYCRCVAEVSVEVGYLKVSCSLHFDY